MDPRAIRNRRDLAQHLQAQMVAARTPWGVEDGEVETEGRTKVKTYLLEAHTNIENPIETLEQIASKLGLRVQPTDDHDLYRLEEDGYDFWCDTSMGRFWRVHTVAEVGVSDTLRDRLVRSTPLFDNVWLPPRYLETLAERTKAHLQTFSLSHDRRVLHDEGAEVSDFDYVTLRLWASRAERTLAKLRDSKVFPRGVSIRNVQLRSGSWEPDEGFCVAEYFHHGKVTASGTSFDEHTRLLVDVLRDYRKLIEGIEERYAIGFATQNDGCTQLSGDPIEIQMQWSVDDLEFAVRRMFTSVEPFRLWALPEKIGKDRYRAYAVDLHVGNTLTFEVGRDRIVILLPRGTCGNTVIRFLSSLSYHVDSDYRSNVSEETLM